jgi:hypothetical protein
VSARRQKRQPKLQARLTTREEIERAEGEGLPPVPEVSIETPSTNESGFRRAERYSNGVGDVNME